jgi:hypothetical protein
MPYTWRRAVIQQIMLVMPSPLGTKLAGSAVRPKTCRRSSQNALAGYPATDAFIRNRRITSSAPQKMKRLAPLLSIGICAAIFILYAVRPNWATAITIFPTWIWLPFAFAAFFSPQRRIRLITLAAWMVYGIFLIEECHSLFRMVLPSGNHPNSITVATLNCSSSVAALSKALQSAPDVVLLQESPSEEEITNVLSSHPDYQCAYGFDASIIARGAITKEIKARLFTCALIDIDSRKIFVVSLRLATSDPRIDLWNPRCWRAQRQMRERQLREMAEVVQALPVDGTLIVGGDFNVPPRDRIFTLFGSRLTDTFSAAGRGWCNTILAELPILRIDQIWISSDLMATNAYARTVPDTDHRLYAAILATPATAEQSGGERR